jgi:hypothetical protein
MVEIATYNGQAVPTTAQLLGFLRAQDACETPLRWVKKHWDPTAPESVLAKADIDMLTWVSVTLRLPMEQEWSAAMAVSTTTYDAAIAPAMAAYFPVRDTTRAAYNAAIDTARAAYDAVTATARAAHDAAIDTADAAYHAAIAPARAAYEAAIDTADAAYDAAIAPARAAYDAAIAPARAAYDAAKAPALAAYDAVTATALAAFNRERLAANNVYDTVLRSPRFIAEALKAWNDWRASDDTRE